MLVTINMLLRTLESWNPTCRMNAAGNQRDGFRRLLLLPETLESSAAQTLYLTNERLWQGQQPEPHHWLICVGTPPELSCNLIILSADAELAEVLNRLLILFEGIAHWERELAVVVSRRGSLPELLRISEHQFENPIIIVDWSLRPVAFTVGIPFTHPDLLHLAEKGRLTDQMVEAISSQSGPQGENYREPGFYLPPNYLGCTQIIKAFAPNPLRLNMLCLYGVNHQPDESDLDKLRQLSDLIEQYSRSFHKDELETYERDIYLLIDLLEHRLDKQELALKAPLLGLQLTADYRFYCIVFQTHIPVRANHLAGQLRTEFPHCRAFVYQSKLWMLAQEQEGSSTVNQILPKLNSLLELHHARCGIGSPFQQLDMLGEGYLQASQAHELGHRLNPERRYYHYYEYYVFHLLSCASKEITWQQLYHSQLNRIIETDRTKGSDNLRLLDVHLNCDRNVSATAQTLHLHRNSVTYRLERIEEMLGMSLDDPEVRLRLLISLKALRYMELEQEE